jgi:hypothetical protein
VSLKHREQLLAFSFAAKSKVIPLAYKEKEEEKGGRRRRPQSSKSDSVELLFLLQLHLQLLHHPGRGEACPPPSKARRKHHCEYH